MNNCEGQESTKLLGMFNTSFNAIENLKKLYGLKGLQHISKFYMYYFRFLSMILLNKIIYFNK